MKTSLFLLLFLLMPAFLPGASPGAFARTITDQTGRRIEVPDTPRRVVSLAPSVTEIIYALGKGEVLQGATRFSDYPEAARSLPKVGSYVKLDLERILALKPDLCIAVKDGTPKKSAMMLQSLGVPVYAVNPVDFATVMASVGELGEILGARDASDALTASIEKRLSAVTARIQKTSRRPRVFIQIGITPIVSAGNGTLIHDLILRAGGENAAAGPTLYPRFSREDVLGLSPDILIITSMSRSDAFEKIKAEWLTWPDLPAARHSRIHLVDSGLFDRPSPRMIDALEKLAELIHPMEGKTR